MEIRMELSKVVGDTISVIFDDGDYLTLVVHNDDGPVEVTITADEARQLSRALSFAASEADA